MNDARIITPSRITGLARMVAVAAAASLWLASACGGGSPADTECWLPFVPAAADSGMLPPESDPERLACRPAAPGAASGTDVVVGSVRVQILSPTLVRIEQRGPSGFEDRCTFVVVDRDWQGAAHTTEKLGADTVVDAGTYRVVVPAGGESLAGTTVLAADGSELYTADGSAPPRAFLPSPSDPVAAWVMGDMPRLIPPAWGATPPPSPRTNSGWDADNDAADVYVFVPRAGGYQQVRSDFLKLTGPVELPPLYTFGLWMSRYYEYTEKTALDTIIGFRKRQIPLDLLVVDTDWRVGGSAGYTPNYELFPDLAAFFAKAHDLDARIMFNDHPEPQGHAELDPEELQFRYDGLTSLLKLGLDLWWFDRNWFTCLSEPVPGISKEVWGMRLYHDVTQRFAPDRRPLIMSNVEGVDNGLLNQPSSPAAHRFPIWWTGDTRATWAYLKHGIENGVLSGALSLLPYVNEDAGGHHGDPSPEMYTRFMQFAALSPVTRPHCTKGQKRLPWEFGAQAEKIVTEHVRLRYRLLPMIYSAARRAYDDGTPLMRRLDLEWPAHPEAADNSQYLFGDDLLVAPVFGNPAQALTADVVTTPDGKPGFQAEYFSGMELKGSPLLVRIDDTIDFNWAMGEPGPGVPKDGFSVRWTGTIGPFQEDGKALFSVTGDDGVRLFVNDKMVLNGWVDQASTEYTATVDMEAGEKYELRLEYYENGGNAICQLLWLPPGHPPANARTVWLPPGVWHDAWSGATHSGPKSLAVTMPLRQTPLFVRDGAVIPTIPQIEHTAAAAWPETVVDVFVPAATTPLRVERFLYEDDGVSPAYRLGHYARTPMVLERSECGARLVLGPTSGSFENLPQSRTWVVRLHLPAGTAPGGLTVNGKETPVNSDAAAAGEAAVIPPASCDQTPLAGRGSEPGPGGGPVVELVLDKQDLQVPLEIRLRPTASGTDADVVPGSGSEPAACGDPSAFPETDITADAPADTEEQTEPQQPEPQAAFMEGVSGFPSANFSVSAEVSPAAELFRRILYNPPVLGSWLEEWGRGTLAVESNGLRITAADCRDRKAHRSWPRSTLEWGDPAMGVRVRGQAWAPVVKGDVAATSLPVLVARLTVDGTPGQAVALQFDLSREKDLAGSASTASDDSGRLDYFSDFGLGWHQLGAGDTASFKTLDARTVSARVDMTLPAGGSRSVTLMLLLWHPDARVAADYADLPALFAGVRKRLADLDQATAAFPTLLPTSGDAKIDEYLRWYMTAGVMLTRVLKDDTTLTMGYAELNQRDSFWTSFMHLLYWPEAERKMLEESAAAVHEGKVPTCILPLIEREDDIDINEYFVLRVARFYREHKDAWFVAALWPAARDAMDYLVGRCEDTALPVQQSCWADWKDVGGVDGRKYGPHFALLYLAALQEMSFLARELGEDAKADEWDAAFAAAEHQVNLPVDEGGLWNGSYYVNVWKDGHLDDALLEDQVVAGAWGVIPPDRFASIVQTLNDTNEQPWGVRDTFPYYPAAEFGYEPGDYHNGAVWPWLNFADALARCQYGLRDDAVRILSEVGYWDLEALGDFLPHENLHGDTGKGIRHYVQGWDSAFLAAVAWGLNRYRP